MPYAVAILKTDRTALPDQVVQVRDLLVQHFDRTPDVAALELVPAGSEDGQYYASAWWLATWFSDEKLVLAQQLAVQFPGSRVESYSLDTQPMRPWELLAEMNLQRLEGVPPS